MPNKTPKRYYVLVKFKKGGWFTVGSSLTKAKAKKMAAFSSETYPGTTHKVVSAAEKDRLGAEYCDNP